MTMINGFSPADAARLDARERQLIERRERLLGPAYRLFYEHPLHTVCKMIELYRQLIAFSRKGLLKSN